MITPKITNLGYSNLWTDMSTILGYVSNFQKLITKIFVNGEQGFFYDPNDLTILYQDVAGTIPVTAAGQPVGLMLDKSKGLLSGSNLILNGSFSSDTSWTKGAGWTIAGGVASFNGSASFSNLGTVTSPSINGKWLRVELDLSNVGVSVTQVRVLVPNSLAATIPVSGAGKYSAIVMGGSTSSIGIQSQNGSGANYAFTLDNVSVKEAFGNHAYQSTSAARPILRNTPRRIDFDTVDDKLTTTFPAQLAGCTVIRSVPNVGTQILTGQTIPVTYMDNTDHCGLLVINRALTPSETSAITSEFNKRAGV